jgi:ribosomal protein L30E
LRSFALEGGTQRIGCREALKAAKIFAAEIILVAAKQNQNTFLSD